MKRARGEQGSFWSLVKSDTLVWVLLLSLCSACQDSSSTTSVAAAIPLKIIIIDNNHSASSAKKYILAHDSLAVYAMQTPINKKDSLVYRCALPLQKVLPASSVSALMALKNRYSNMCLVDGSEISIALHMKRRIKTIQLHSYYQENIGQFLRALNLHLPEQHQIWYDKEELLLGQERCANAFSE